MSDMYHHLPNLNALRIFESAARNLSFTKAAEELHISQSAVSHQIRKLEAQMGVQLFVRLTRALALTDQGNSLFQVVYSAFEELGAGVSKIYGQDRPSKLSISLSFPLGAKWLSRHLSRFSQLFPESQLRLSYSRDLADFMRQDCDLAIQWSVDPLVPADRGSLIAEYLLPAELIPVCSPQFDLSNWPGDKPHCGPRKVAQSPEGGLLHLDGFGEWQSWYKKAGFDPQSASAGPVVDDPLVNIFSALAGSGIALMRLPLIIEELTLGELKPASPITIEKNHAYWLVYPKRMLRRPIVKAFQEFLLEQAVVDRERLAPFQAGK